MRRPLRGRSAEVAALLDALRAALRKRSTVALIRGEPGIGKTALTDAVVQQAGRMGYAVAASAAHETDKVTPLASLGPALRFGVEPLLTSSDFMGLAELHEQHLWLVERLATLVERRAAEQPVLVVLDDAQWSDPLTTFVLRVLPKRLLSSPVLWLLATRDVPGGPADHVAEAARPDVPVLRTRLSPLGEDAVLAMAADRLGRRPDAAVTRRLMGAQGSPFLASQLLEGLFEPDASGPAAGGVPGGLAEGVRRRVAATSAQSRDLVRAAAVLGPPSALADIAYLLDAAPGRLADSLAEAIQAGLLTDDGTGVRFRHELLREAVYEDIPPSARRAYHQAIVGHFLSSGRDFALIAPHVLATAVRGDAAAVDVLRKAALEVVATMSTTSAAFIRQAFDLTAEDDPRRVEIGTDVVQVLIADRQYTAAETFADGLLSAGTGPDQAAVLQLMLLPRLWAVGALAEVGARAGDSRAKGAADHLSARLSAYGALAARGARATGAETGAQTDTQTDAETDAETGALSDSATYGGDPAASALAHAAAAELAESKGEYALALASYERARKAARDAAGAVGTPPPGHVELRALMARARLDDLDGVLRELEDVRPGDPRFPAFWQAPQVAWVRACLALGAGRLHEAATHAETSLRLMKEVGEWSFVQHVRHILAALALLRADRAGARAQLEAAEEDGGTLPVLRALLADADGDLRGTAELVRLLRTDTADEAEWVPWREELLVSAARTAHHEGDEAIGREAAEVLAGLAAGNPGAASTRGAAALARGRTAEELASAVETLRGTGRRLLLARAEEEYGRAELEAGDRENAIGALDRAWDLFTESGATGPATRVQRFMRAAGVRRRRWPSVPERPADGWEALTGTERRVALLVADGHTNRSAAAELFLSPSTINTHLRAVFSKLGVHSRVQLAGVVLRRDGEPPPDAGPPPPDGRRV